MSEYADEGEWAKVLVIINQLWPAGGKFQDGLNAQQMKEWQARLRGRNQLLVRAAVRNVFADKAGPRPRLSWILKELRVLEQHQQVGQTKERDDRKSEDDAIWDENVREADRLRPILTELPEEELRRLKVIAIGYLATVRGFTTPARERHAVAERDRFIQGVHEGTSNDPEKWSPIVVNLIGEIRQQEEREYTGATK